MFTRSGSSLAAALLASATLQAAVPSYTSIEIHSPASATDSVGAAGINRYGDVVGAYSSAPGVTPQSAGGFVYYYRNRSEVVLSGSGTPGGLSANGINDLDQVVGDLMGPSIGVEPVEWLKSGGEVVLPIGTLALASAINDKGDIVGNYDNGHLDNLAILWQGSSHTPVNLGVLWVDPTLPDYASSTATGINSLSHVVGTSNAGEGTDPNTAQSFGQHAFLYRNGRMQDLGALALSKDGSDYSVAFGVNNLDQVVGSSTTAIPARNSQGQPCSDCGVASHAFLWRAGKMTDLGNLASIPGWDSEAKAIDDRGEIVGWSDSLVNGSSTHRAFLYVGGQMLNLQFYVFDRDPNVRLTEAVGINCEGWIVANGFNVQTPNIGRIYLLIPRGPARTCS
jgi:probable HAF family extracellular repeat protein